MSEVGIDNFDFICRVCLSDSNKMHSIFQDTTCSSRSIVEKFNICTKLSIFANDTYPGLICDTCLVELNRSYDFYLKSNESDIYLRKLSKNCNESHFVTVEIKEELIVDDDYSNGYDPDKFSYSNVSSDTTKKDDFKKILPDDDRKLLSSDSIKIPKIKSHKNGKCHNKINVNKKRSVDKLKLKNGKSNNVNHSNLLECKTCGLQTRSNSALIIHKRTHTGEKPHVCAKCNKSFAQTSTLKMHILRNHVKNKINLPRNHVCEHCGKSFVNGSVLKIHMRRHTGETPYECSICLKRFMQLGSLVLHRRRHMGVRPYSCKICSKTFVEPSHLRRHQTVHSTETPYICNICGKGLKSSYTLRQHTKLHSDLKEHVCDQCGMKFGIKCNLETHVRLIHSEKSGLCAICDKSYSDLADHMVKHTGEKPYQCEICSKRFARKRGLVAHNRQHKSADKYKCHIEGCNKSFYAQWILECHIMKHTGLTAYSCKHCSKGFLRRCHLNRHMKLNHPNENNEKKSTNALQLKDE